MIISHTHRFMFFCNGKSGSTSIESVLAKYQEGEEYNFNVPGLFYRKHVPPAYIKACMPTEAWDSYYKFVIVRNPWDWAASNWKYNFEKLPKQRAKKQKMLRTLLNRITGDDPNFTTPLETESLSAAEINHLAEYLKTVRGYPNSLTVSQGQYVNDQDGKQIVDYVGRFETLEEDFASICNTIGIEETLPHINKTRATSSASFYSPSGIQRVAELWADDIKQFGYKAPHLS